MKYYKISEKQLDRLLALTRQLDKNNVECEGNHAIEFNDDEKALNDIFQTLYLVEMNAISQDVKA